MKEGDVVRHRRGGPRMTVERVGRDWADCVWLEGDVEQRETWLQADLVVEDPD